jgi:protein gp37
MKRTKIPWATHVWNPIRGCSKHSRGCRRCYALRIANRFCGPGLPWEGFVLPDGSDWSGKVALIEDTLREPEGGKPKTVFVGSTADLFGDGVKEEWLVRIFTAMVMGEKHRYMILTKRAERLLSFFEEHKAIIRNIRDLWAGVTVENQKAADVRIPLLLKTQAKKMYVSYEPAVEYVEFASSLGGTRWMGGQRGCEGTHRGVGTPECPKERHHHHDDRCLRGLDLIIMGAETGENASPMDIDWARKTRDLCAWHEVAFFMKQLTPDGSRILDGVLHNSIERPKGEVYVEPVFFPDTTW